VNIKNINEVYQFKISLNNTKPSVWRRIQVPSSYSFWDLHVAIQDSMGWLDYHLHIFEIKNPKSNRIIEIGIPDEDDDLFDRKVLADHKEKILNYFDDVNNKARYEYDFGDSWIHTIKLEKTLPLKIEEKYPKCIAGRMACPPEDCGGIGGYYHLMEVLNNPKDEEYSEMLDWLGEEFMPEEFDPKDVIFDDPKERFNEMNED